MLGKVPTRFDAQTVLLALGLPAGIQRDDRSLAFVPKRERRFLSPDAAGRRSVRQIPAPEEVTVAGGHGSCERRKAVDGSNLTAALGVEHKVVLRLLAVVKRGGYFRSDGVKRVEIVSESAFGENDCHVGIELRGHPFVGVFALGLILEPRTVAICDGGHFLAQKYELFKRGIAEKRRHPYVCQSRGQSDCLQRRNTLKGACSDRNAGAVVGKVYTCEVRVVLERTVRHLYDACRHRVGQALLCRRIHQKNLLVFVEQHAVLGGKRRMPFRHVEFFQFLTAEKTTLSENHVFAYIEARKSRS